jgi:hypothetical protein
VCHNQAHENTNAHTLSRLDLCDRFVSPHCVGDRRHGERFVRSRSIVDNLIGGPWSNITFNFIATDGLPTAAGSLYLLTQEFLGTADELSTSLPGFVATSQSAGGLYTFDPSLTLAASTQYFVYANTSLRLTGSGLGSYLGGDAYGVILGTNFSRFTGPDANFLLAGTPVSAHTPESGSLVLMGLGLAAFWITYRRRRYLSPAP